MRSSLATRCDPAASEPSAGDTGHWRGSEEVANSGLLGALAKLDEESDAALLDFELLHEPDRNGASATPAGCGWVKNSERLCQRLGEDGAGARPLVAIGMWSG